MCFHIQVSQYLRPVRTPGDHIDLERRLRSANFPDEADDVKGIGDKVHVHSVWFHAVLSCPFDAAVRA